MRKNFYSTVKAAHFEALDEKAVVRKLRTTAVDGKNHNTIYNLGIIISLGCRVKF